MQAELQNTQKLQQSVVVLGRAKRELVKAAASIEEVNLSRRLTLCTLATSAREFLVHTEQKKRDPFLDG